MPKMIIEFDFDVDEREELYKDLILKKIKAEFIDGMTVDGGKSLAESWAQSDYYWVGVTNALIEVIGGGEIDGDDVKNSY